MSKMLRARELTRKAHLSTREPWSAADPGPRWLLAAFPHSSDALLGGSADGLQAVLLRGDRRRCAAFVGSIGGGFLVLRLVCAARFVVAELAPFDYAGTVALSAVLAAALPEVVNVFANKSKCAMRAAKASGDLIECLMQEAVDSKGRMLVEISTIGSKCYIGFALESGVAAGNESDIAITPIASGYRHGETRELRITRNYLPALRKSKLEVAEFRVVIPLAQIASARRFDPDAYKLLRHARAGDAEQG